MSSRVPESVRLKEKRDTALREQERTRALEREAELQHVRDECIRRAERYSKEYKEMEREEIRKKRQARRDCVYLTEKGERLVFVIRIRGVNEVPPKPRKVLELFRLVQINTGVFLRVNASTLRMLELIGPYVTYGYPTVSTIRSLIYKRGYGRVKKQRVPLSSNEVVSDVLGKFNVICIEDVIHELYVVGEHFKEVNSFLWPFKLNPPTGGFRNVKTHFNEGGDCGNRECCINNLIARMM